MTKNGLFEVVFEHLFFDRCTAKVIFFLSIVLIFKYKYQDTFTLEAKLLKLLSLASLSDFMIKTRGQKNLPVG